MPRSRYGRWYARGAYAGRARTIAAVVLVVLYLLARFVAPGLDRLLMGMSVPYLILLFLLVLAWPVGAMHDKRIATVIMGILLLLIALHVI